MRYSNNEDNVINHYDILIDENNDPARDPKPLQVYMDKWDGQIFIEELKLSPEKFVLEIGVGTGRLAMRICDNCKTFTGVDISPKTVKRAKENLNMFSNAKLILGNFLTYQFHETFDVIYSSLTFMHIKDKKTAIQKIADLLKERGRFVLSIDKAQENEIEFGTHRITIFPNNSASISAFITESGLNINKKLETEFAVIFVATK